MYVHSTCSNGSGFTISFLRLVGTFLCLLSMIIIRPCINKVSMYTQGIGGYCSIQRHPAVYGCQRRFKQFSCRDVGIGGGIDFQDWYHYGPI